LRWSLCNKVTEEGDTPNRVNGDRTGHVNLYFSRRTEGSPGESQKKKETRGGHHLELRRHAGERGKTKREPGQKRRHADRVKW